MYAYLNELIEKCFPLGCREIILFQARCYKGFVDQEIPLTGSGGMLNYFSFRHRRSRLL